MPWSTIKPDLNEPLEALTPGVGKRRITYAEAVREALCQALAVDDSVFVMGQGVDDPSGMFGTTRGLADEFGRDRVFDTPLSESALTGIAAGAAMAGMRPVYFHNRPDFLLLAFDQLANHAAKWSYMFGGRVRVPLVVWACTGRGWGSGPQHSQALQGLFMHVPGLKLVMPGSCYDAKGLLLSAVKDDNPVLILDHRMNFRNMGFVPQGMYTIPLGKGVVRRTGADVTIVAVSHLVSEALLAAGELESESGIQAEVVDPRTLRPLDESLILVSLAKTGHLVVADTGWKTGGVTAEIAALACEKGFSSLKAPVCRVACPDLPTPSGYTLEEAYYVGKKEIKDGVYRVLDMIEPVERNVK
ncbi:MAG: transketolase C-terminal domain-containing protein [Pseudomonadota bacterium]